jgi:hypothetical protein
MNFAELQAEVGLWLRDVPADTLGAVPNLINEAIIDAQREHNFACMAASASFTTTDGSHTLGTITNFKGIREDPFWLDRTMQRIIRWATSREDVQKRWPDASIDGPPHTILLASISATASTFEVWPLSDGRCDTGSDGQYPITLPVWTYLPRLISSGDSNWFTNEGSSYIRYATLAKATLLNLDEARAGSYMQLAQVELEKLRRTQARGRTGRPEQLGYSLGAYPRRRYY